MCRLSFAIQSMESPPKRKGAALALGLFSLGFGMILGALVINHGKCNSVVYVHGFLTKQVPLNQSKSVQKLRGFTLFLLKSTFDFNNKILSG